MSRIIVAVLCVLATVAVVSMSLSRPAGAALQCFTAGNNITSCNASACFPPEFTCTDFGWISSAPGTGFDTWSITRAASSNVITSGAGQLVLTPSVVWVTTEEDDEQYWITRGAFVQLAMTGNLNTDDADGWVDVRATHSLPNPDWVHNFTRITIEEACP